jgi:hypothetical protein
MFITHPVGTPKLIWWVNIESGRLNFGGNFDGSRHVAIKQIPDDDVNDFWPSSIILWVIADSSIGIPGIATRGNLISLQVFNLN